MCIFFLCPMDTVSSSDWRGASLSSFQDGPNTDFLSSTLLHTIKVHNSLIKNPERLNLHGSLSLACCDSGNTRTSDKSPSQSTINWLDGRRCLLPSPFTCYDQQVVLSVKEVSPLLSPPFLLFWLSSSSSSSRYWTGPSESESLSFSSSSSCRHCGSLGTTEVGGRSSLNADGWVCSSSSSSSGLTN